MSTPTAAFSDDFYRFAWADEQVTMEMERFAEQRGGGIKCELTVKAEPRQGPLYSGTFNLLTNNAPLANKLDRIIPDIDWDGLLTQVAGIAKEQYREGEPIVDLADVQPNESRYLLYPLITEPGVTALIADGGSGKSLLALACGLAVATGIPIFGHHPSRPCEVLYLDWEADAGTHSERLRALCRGLGIDVPKRAIHYRRMVASMHESAPVIRKQLAKLGGDLLVVVDSIGLARGGAPESAEETIKLFGALRSLNVPVLAVDHISKESKAKTGGNRDPIGSIYTRNSARLVWSMEKAQQGESSMAVALRNSKNNRRELPPESYRLDFEEDEEGALLVVRIAVTDLRAVPELYQPSRKYQVADAIKQAGGAAPVKEIAETIGITEARTRGVLNEHADWFTRVGGVRDGHWSLVSNREEQ